MSENLNVTAHLSAIDTASPVIDKLLAKFRSMEQRVKRFNASFAGLGSASAFNRFSGMMDKAQNASKAAADDYGRSWKQAHSERLQSERRLYASLAQMDNAAHARRQVHRAAFARGTSTPRTSQPQATERMSRSSSSGRAFAPVPTPYAAMIAGTGIAASVSAFKKRLEADSAETKAIIFGELSRDAIKSARKDWIDRDAIKFGTAPAKVMDAFTESL